MVQLTWNCMQRSKLCASIEWHCYWPLPSVWSYTYHIHIYYILLLHIHTYYIYYTIHALEWLGMQIPLPCQAHSIECWWDAGAALCAAIKVDTMQYSNIQSLSTGHSLGFHSAAPSQTNCSLIKKSTNTRSSIMSLPAHWPIGFGADLFLVLAGAQVCAVPVELTDYLSLSPLANSTDNKLARTNGILGRFRLQTLDENCERAWTLDWTGMYVLCSVTSASGGRRRHTHTRMSKLYKQSIVIFSMQFRLLHLLVESKFHNWISY